MDPEDGTGRHEAQALAQERPVVSGPSIFGFTIAQLSTRPELRSCLHIVRCYSSHAHLGTEVMGNAAAGLPWAGRMQRWLWATPRWRLLSERSAGPHGKMAGVSRRLRCFHSPPEVLDVVSCVFDPLGVLVGCVPLPGPPCQQMRPPEAPRGLLTAGAARHTWLPGYCVS